MVSEAGRAVGKLQSARHETDCCVATAFLLLARFPFPPASCSCSLYFKMGLTGRLRCCGQSNKAPLVSI
jgi:hypothetical protein